jgi:hypothetical protein
MSVYVSTFGRPSIGYKALQKALHQAFKFVTLISLIVGDLSIFFKYLLKAHSVGRRKVSKCGL